jgi:outer membrane murein-binding lipoprotein Lpp
MIRKIFIIVLFIGITNSLFSQENVEVVKKIEKLQTDVSNLKSSNNALKNSVNQLSEKVYKLSDSLAVVNDQLNLNTKNISKTAEELGVKIQKTDDSASKKISDLDNTVSQNTLYWIIAILSVVVLTLIIFFFLRKKISNDKTEIGNQISETKKSLEEEGIKLDNKLASLLESQLKLMSAERSATNITASSTSKEEVDHSLALKVADEIIRIQKNIMNMDQETKGLKQLAASVKRIQENFESNGYELVDMLNKPYDAGMKVVANFRPDESLKPGEQIITRIIKPQVNFKGVMIQSAQIEVSQGE